MPPRKVPPDEVLIEMYMRPMSAGEIAKELDLNKITVASALTRIPSLKMRSQSEAQKLSFAHGRKVNTYWKGKKQPPDLVERRVSKIRGENHYLWKGGLSTRGYRVKIKKVVCEQCMSRLNLCVHHKNFDHYDNEESNLQVLCVSCHLSLHKKRYWESIRNGGKPGKSTAKHHWTKGGG